MDRQLVMNRRRYQMQAPIRPLAANWWEACSLGQSDCIEFQLCPRSGGGVVARLGLWDMEPLGTQRPLRTFGLVQLEVQPSFRRQGLATMLVCEAMAYARQQACAIMEVQTMQDNSPALALYQKLGFEQIDQGLIFRKAALP
jgi:GNAT superfamily N-acetyltransferase